MDFMFFGIFSKTAQRGLHDVPRPRKGSDFCLELYLLLPLFLFLIAATKENLTRRLYKQHVWGCGDDTPQAYLIYIYIYIHIYIYINIYTHSTCKYYSHIILDGESYECPIG